MAQNRQTQRVAIPGIRDISGNIVTPLWPDAGMELFAGAIGAETATTGSTPTNATTLAAAVSAGATTISTTATFAVNDIVQVDTNASNLAECRKVTVVTGSGPYSLTLDSALARAHANGVAVAKVVAPFTHTLSPTPALPSFSIEKNMNGADIQYAGCLVNKVDLALATNAEAKATYAMIGQQDTVIGSPATPTFPTDTPYSPTGISVSVASVADATCSSATFSLDNMVKAYKTFNQHDYPDLVVATNRKVSGKITVFLQALSGGTPPNYYAELEGAGNQAVVINFTQGANAVAISLPAAVLTKAANPLRIGDLVMQDLEYEGIIGGSNNTDIAVTVTNGNYVSY